MDKIDKAVDALLGEGTGEELWDEMLKYSMNYIQDHLDDREWEEDLLADIVSKYRLSQDMAKEVISSAAEELDIGLVPFLFN